MANQVMRITLKAYDHQLVDASAAKIIETVKKNGAMVSGPVPLPTKKEVVTILRAVHKYKDSREQFEQRTHKRLIDILTPTQKTVDALSRLLSIPDRTGSIDHKPLKPQLLILLQLSVNTVLTGRAFSHNVKNLSHMSPLLHMRYYTRSDP